MDRLDWSLVEVFLAVAETGSLSGAARALGSSQPTVGRQIREIETQLGAVLFQRQPRGLSLTDTGAALVTPANAMRGAMHRISLTAAGQQESLEGSVRLTASMIMSVFHLPELIAEIRLAEPSINIELVASDASRNLLFREADIAIRMYRPTQRDLVARHLGNMEMAAYASKSYLSRHGMPRKIEDLLSHDLVGFDDNPAIIEGFATAGLKVDREMFKLRCDDQVAYWQLVRAGGGIGFMQRSIGRADPMVEEVELGLYIPPLPIWLTAHQAMRQTPRISRVWDLLSTGLMRLVS